MCIIVAKPEGVSFPSEQILRNCFNNNSDGAGFMFARNKQVNIRKGFMTFDEFLEALEAENIKDNETCVMHFRIGTQGGNVPKNCHPFPIPCNENTVTSLECAAPIGLVHNGVISLCSDNRSSISDTMQYAIDIVSPLYRLYPSFMIDDNSLEILENTAKSKLCFINGFGDLVTIGEFIENNGILYSNNTYASKVYGYSTYKSLWDNYDYEEDEYDIPLFENCRLCCEYEGCKEFGRFCQTQEAVNEYLQEQWMDEYADETGVGDYVSSYYHR